MRFLLIIILTFPCFAQKFYTYIGDLAPDSVIIAWGTIAESGNTIGREARGYGKATLWVGDRSTNTDQAWAAVGGLVPDTKYDYRVEVKGKKIAGGSFRTWPAASEKLCFIAIGDFGTGGSGQRALAKTMTEEVLRRQDSDCPIRFIITTGDNIYADGLFGFRNTGNEDEDWERKFFQPYERINTMIPWYPTLGNHDGNESENRGDLNVYLDNFFFPGGKSARYYSFSYGGGLAEFFALDSTTNTAEGKRASAFYEAGPQFKWMVQVMKASKAKWKIPYFHHPLFGAGPRHEPSLGELQHFIKLFRDIGVRVVFNGHEHNFQVSEKNERSGEIRFIITGAGGELRTGDVRHNMEPANIAGWAPQHHFSVVEIDDDDMEITPVSYTEMVVFKKDGKPLDLPIKVEAP
jgi:hypothetical protein